MADLGIYMGTSVWICSFDEHVPDMQRQTLSFFEQVERNPQAEAYISDVVLQELGSARNEREALLADLIVRVGAKRLNLDEESAALAEAYVNHGVLTAGHLVDARHVAIAAVAELDVLVSWNYRHLVNRRRREAFNGVNAILGYRPIDIVSPPEVFDD